jgi:prophage tail gpP-like protein/phage tail protein X
LSTTFRTREGDTFESISRRAYGTETESGLIAKANPGASEPLAAGLNLTVPLPVGLDLTALPPQQSKATGSNEVSVEIEGKRFRFWTSIRIVRAIDAIDVVEFTAPFKHDAPGFRETFVPLSYKPLTVTAGGEPIFKGRLLTVNPDLEPVKKTFSVGGYATPGVLTDCNPSPASPSELEFTGMTLQGIAESIVKPFGVSVIFRDDPGPVFERIAADPNRRVWAFLTDLAQQRNLVISSTPTGELVFQRSVEPTGFAPEFAGINEISFQPSVAKSQLVARLKQGESPLMSVKPFFNPRDYYSHVTGVEPVFVGLGGSQFTVKNERLLGVFRPYTFTAQDTQEGDVKAAVEAKAGRMFANMASYSIKVDTWRDAKGRLWEPNTFISLEAPDAMVYEPYSFIIRSITFDRGPKSETATLNLVLPGSFAGKLPETLPWLT